MGNESKEPTEVLDLRAAITVHDGAKAALSQRRANFEELIETDAARVKMLASNVENLKDKIRPLAIAEYKATTHKKMWGGVGIQEKKSMTYDAVKAFAFAKEKDMFLKLDVATFEKAASALGLDFVKIEKVPTVTWPKEWKS